MKRNPRRRNSLDRSFASGLNDASVSDQPLDVPVIECGDRRDVEAEERTSEPIALSEDGEPGRPNLEKHVHVMGGADIIRQALAGGYVNELTIIIAPVVLGGGKRLFEGFTRGDLGRALLGS
jgi:riboflavin biosynthesis pyrimidine reductase